MPNGSSGIDEHAWVVQAFHIDGSSDEEISLGVFTFRNGEYTSQYMAIANSYNYNMDDTLVANVILSSETQNYDNGAFRLRYVPAEHAYRIAPICSGNGYYRVISRGIGSMDIGINEIRGSNSNYQLFNILRFSDGSIGFQMKGTAKTLSIENGEVVLRDYAEGNLKQHWFASTYMYKDSGMTYASVDEYYHSLDFGSPFGANGRSLVMTSGYGPRDYDSSPMHHGVDFRAYTGTSLYSPTTGTVAEISYSPTDPASGTGNYVVIETDYTQLGSTKKLYVIYMHMSVVSQLGIGDQISLTDKLGETGATGGNYSSHLHYQIFFAESGLRSTNAALRNNNSISPLLFCTPDEYAVSAK